MCLIYNSSSEPQETSIRKQLSEEEYRRRQAIFRDRTVIGDYDKALKEQQEFGKLFTANMRKMLQEIISKGKPDSGD